MPHQNMKRNRCSHYVDYRIMYKL